MASPREYSSTYRLIVTRRNASEILLLPAGPGWALPRAEILPQERVAQQLTGRVRRAWGLEACCLFVAGDRMSDSSGKASCAFMESVGHNDQSPAGTFWMPVSAAASCGDSPDVKAIREALAELDSHRKSGGAAPFAQPGWLRELFRWSQEQVSSLGLRLNGRFQQLNASPTFSLIRLEAEEAALWFKAAGEPNSHELPVTVAAARLLPHFVPRILAVRQEWNGWLAWEAPGRSLDECSDVTSWIKAAAAFAELQVESIGEGRAWLDCGCRDLRLSRLAGEIEPFLARMNECMAAQQSNQPAALRSNELALVAAQLKEACSLLDGLALPNALGHVDLNPGNIVISPERCIFLDWAEGSIGPPFLTFHYLREHCGRTLRDPAAADKITSAYLRPWSRIFSPEAIAGAMAVSPLLAVFAYAVGNEKWRHPGTPQSPALSGYFRSLTRRMHQEALRLAGRREPCPA